MKRSQGLARPPEGALVGENVPRENEAEAWSEAELDAAVGILKTFEAYHGKSDDELREVARYKLGEVN